MTLKLLKLDENKSRIISLFLYNSYMNKEINYLIEILAKFDENKDSYFYKDILDFFKYHYIYSVSKYEIKTLNVLAKRDGFQIPANFSEALKALDKKLELYIDKDISEAKKQLFDTIISSNFKKEKESFDKVESSIYKCLLTYISGLTRSFELFFIYTKNDVKEPEIFIEFASHIHEKLLKTVFNKEERKLLDDKLKEIMSVYLSVYARYLYV